MNENNLLFHEYFSDWIKVYKQGAVRPVTYKKYLLTLQRLTELAPSLTFSELDKRKYQILINEYAKTHEKETTMNFHHQLKGVILDAIDEGLLKTDPTRKVVIKGKENDNKKPKFLNQSEIRLLCSTLNLHDKINWDWFILLLAKTGMRFAEALALTPNDFDFENQKVKITKTWKYRKIDGDFGGFGETKNYFSKRTIQLDPLLNDQLKELIKDIANDQPIFISTRIFNSTVNGRLKTLCKKANIPVISLHALRHTHASILLFAGVSIASVAKRLGHANITTTQETYLHIIKELEDKDNEKVVNYLTSLTAGGNLLTA
ncbi:MAG: site-specific integrase [Treponema sp.]|nr:site-specific integrase [Treponema sp.]